jgi:hypothetical protein
VGIAINILLFLLLIIIICQAYSSGRWRGGIAVSNPVGAMDVFLLEVLCVVRQSFLRRSDHLSGILPIVVCLCVIEEPHRRGLGLLGAVGT